MSSYNLCLWQSFSALKMKYSKNKKSKYPQGWGGEIVMIIEFGVDHYQDISTFENSNQTVLIFKYASWSWLNFSITGKYHPFQGMRPRIKIILMFKTNDTGRVRNRYFRDVLEWFHVKDPILNWNLIF